MAYNRELSQFASFVEVGVNNTIGITTSVGIGTTNPTSPLEIFRFKDPIQSNGALISLKHHTTNSAYPYAGISIDHYCQNTGLNQGGAFIQFSNNGTQEAVIQYDDDIGTNNGLLIKNNTDGPIYFQTNGSNERVRITSSGNIGIGTTNPTQKLHIYDTTSVGQLIESPAEYSSLQVKSGIGTTAIEGIFYASSIEGGVVLRNNSNTVGSGLGLCGTQSSGADLIIFRATRNVVIGNNPSIASQTGTANQKLQVQSGAYISGSVGIGTTNPQYKLQVQGNIFVGNDPIPSTIGINTASIFLYGVPKRGIYWAPTSDTHYVKYDSTIIDGLTINGYSGLVFSTGSTTNATWAERMRMDISGNLGIGTTNPQYKLHVIGDAYVTGAFGIGSSLTVNGSIYPSIDATYDLGSPTNSWRNIYTNDLNLSNEKMDKGNDIDGTKGNWTIQEGEDHLYIINNKNGKKYKFFLEEIS